MPWLSRGKRGIGHGQKGKRYGKGADGPGFELPFDDQIEDDDGPGKENHRFVHIGQRSMADAHLVGLYPAQAKTAVWISSATMVNARSQQFLAFWLLKYQHADIEQEANR